MTPATVNKDIRIPIKQRSILSLYNGCRVLRKIETLLLFSPFLTNANTVVSVSVSQSDRQTIN